MADPINLTYTHAAISPLAERLVKAGFHADFADEIVRRVRDFDAIQSKNQQLLDALGVLMARSMADESYAGTGAYFRSRAIEAAAIARSAIERLRT